MTTASVTDAALASMTSGELEQYIFNRIQAKLAAIWKKEQAELDNLMIYGDGTSTDRLIPMLDGSVSSIQQVGVGASKV